MPFIDFNTKDFESADHDVTIIGAGAAGILLAHKLSEGGNKVLLIESGNFKFDPDKQSLNDVIQTGKDLSNSKSGRIRVLGEQQLPGEVNLYLFHHLILLKENGWKIVGGRYLMKKFLLTIMKQISSC